MLMSRRTSHSSALSRKASSVATYFVPFGGLQIGRDDLQVTATKEQVWSAPDIEMHGEELSQADESTLYHHFEMNYTPINTESERRLARC
jgi:hypothetical protein